MGRHRILLTCLLLIAGAISPAAVAGADELPKTPLFSRHVVPLFSRLGCNAGLCHGAVQGKNGFRLSLFGVEPAQDHSRLLRDLGGRRLNLQDPDQSLLLLKATGQVPHEGGRRMEVGSPEYKLLRNWVASGALLGQPNQIEVKRLTLSPTRPSLRRGESLQLRVEAAFADGTKEDVTALCFFESRDKGVSEIDRDGLVRATGPGDTALVARYRAQPVITTVVVPTEAKDTFPEVTENNFIDKQIVDKLRRLNVPPADLCDDATFLRRVSLDVTGALPTPDETRAFLTDKNPIKRAMKIDELLQRPGHSAVWATKFCDLLRPRISYQDFTHQPAPAATRRFHEWIRARLRENTPYDELAARILTATSLDGRTREEWIQEVIAQCEEEAAGFPTGKSKYAEHKTLDLYWHRFDSTGVKGTVQIAHAFLGLRLQCAQCHRHPTDVWTQDDLLSFANFFTRVRANTGVLSVKEAAEVKKVAGGVLLAEEKKKLQEEAKDLGDQSKKLQGQAKGKDKAEAEKIQREAKALQDKSNARARAVAILDCSQVFPVKGNVFGSATVTSPLGTQKSERFRFPGEVESVTVRDDQDPRELVAAWFRRPGNAFFAKAIVNRVWAHYFGCGLVEPVDDLSPLNPPTHPELLDELCRRFIENKYDLKWLHLTILNSRTYQLAHRTSPGNQHDTRNFAYFYRRRLPAEALLDAINDATGASEKFQSQVVSTGSRALDVPVSVLDGGIGSKFVEYTFTIFGRPTRNVESLCDCDRETQPALLQSLYLANHPEVLKKISDPKGRVAQILKEHKEDARRIEEIYLWTLSRFPTEAERNICLEHLKKSPSAQKGLEGVLWSLLNTSEFVLNH